MVKTTYEKRTQKSVHNSWCNTVINRSYNRKIKTVKPVKKSPIQNYNYSNYELKNIFEKYLTK